jgi:hypothetical protein
VTQTHTYGSRTSNSRAENGSGSAALGALERRRRLLPDVRLAEHRRDPLAHGCCCIGGDPVQTIANLDAVGRRILDVERAALREGCRGIDAQPPPPILAIRSVQHGRHQHAARLGGALGDTFSGREPEETAASGDEKRVAGRGDACCGRIPRVERHVAERMAVRVEDQHVPSAASQLVRSPDEHAIAAVAAEGRRVEAWV